MEQLQKSSKECSKWRNTQPKLFSSTLLNEDHNGLMNDCEIILIDKMDSSDPTRRVFFWMRVLKTIAPLGLNIDEGYDY